jgi:hypothetical protein
VEAPKIETHQLITRHLAAGRKISHMFFPDNLELRNASEIIFRTKFAEQWSERFAQLGEEKQKAIILAGALGSVKNPPRFFADPQAWMRRRLFDNYLGPFGGAIGAALALKDSPSEHALEQDGIRRWFGVVFTGRLMLLIGSIDQHTRFGASLNKAIHVVRETEGANSAIKALLKQFNYPGIYDSSLKKAWRTFKPVAHLCGAYVITELLYGNGNVFRDIFRDFTLYCQRPPALFQFTAFSMFCAYARFIEHFVTSFRPHGQRYALLSKEEIYSLDRILGTNCSLQLSFPTLDDEELASLDRYQAPKSLV